jgi:peroxiredoxin
MRWSRLVHAALAAGFAATCAVAAQPQPGKGPSAPALVDAPAPAALALKDVQGAVHDLSQYRGRVVLVNFWATWCEPCREELPSIQRLRDKLAGKPFVALAINVDEPDARVRRFVSETRLDVPVLLDPNKNVTRAWGVRVLPATFIVGPEGRVRYRLVGEADWSDEKIVDLVSKLIYSS